MDDYEECHDTSCSKCGHRPIHQRDCTNFCNEGYHDESDDDPINFMPGEELRECSECKGTGCERWCPSCGENLSGVELIWDDDEQ